MLQHGSVVYWINYFFIMQTEDYVVISHNCNYKWSHWASLVFTIISIYRTQALMSESCIFHQLFLLHIVKVYLCHQTCQLLDNLFQPKRIKENLYIPGGMPIYSSPSILRGWIKASSSTSWNFFPDACCFKRYSLLQYLIQNKIKTSGKQ